MTRHCPRQTCMSSGTSGGGLRLKCCRYMTLCTSGARGTYWMESAMLRTTWLQVDAQLNSCLRTSHSQLALPISVSSSGLPCMVVVHSLTLKWVHPPACRWILMQRRWKLRGQTRSPVLQACSARGLQLQEQIPLTFDMHG